MATLAEIRAKYPQYNDMDDATFADAFHKKFYLDMPRADFDAKLGITKSSDSPDDWRTSNLYPISRNIKTGDISLAIPGFVQGMVDLATGKIDPQAMDPVTGEFHTNPAVIGPAMDTAMTIAGAPPAKLAATKVGSGIAKILPKLPEAPGPKVPVIPATEWQVAKTNAYKAVDDLGARYSQSGFDRLVDQMDVITKADKINPKLHPNASEMIATLKSAKGSTPSLTELDQWRQIVRRDVKGSEAEGHFGEKMVDAIDDFISNATGRDMVAGDPKMAANAVLAARKANATFRKSEVIEDALKAAERQAARAGSGGNIDNAIRQQIDAILRNKKRLRFFSKAEREAMERVVKGTDWQNRARLIGKLSPEGNGLSLMLHLLGSGFSGGMTVPAAIAGYAAKRYADQATKSNLDDVLRLIQGGPTP